jgi:hypothetical protein
MATFPTFHFPGAGIQSSGAFAPAQIDFSKIGQIADSYYDAQNNRMKRDAFQEQQAAARAERDRQNQVRQVFAQGLPRDAQGNIDYSAASERLLALDPNQGVDFLKMGSQEADRRHSREFDREKFNADQAYRQQQLGLQREQLAPSDVRSFQAYSALSPEDQERYRAFRQQQATSQKRSVTEMKQIYEADDEIPKIQNTIDTLKYARELIAPTDKDAPKAYEGTGAGFAGWVGSRVPGGSFLFDEGRAKATDEYGTIMSMEAIKAMASTLKGVTTDFELRKFESILADPTQPREIRLRTIERMLQLAEHKRALEERRAQEIRSGEYYGPTGFVPPQAPASTGGSIPTIRSDADYDNLPSGAEFIDPEGKRRRKP